MIPVSVRVPLYNNVPLCLALLSNITVIQWTLQWNRSKDPRWLYPLRNFSSNLFLWKAIRTQWDILRKYAKQGRQKSFQNLLLRSTFSAWSMIKKNAFRLLYAVLQAGIWLKPLKIPSSVPCTVEKNKYHKPNIMLLK